MRTGEKQQADSSQHSQSIHTRWDSTNLVFILLSNSKHRNSLPSMYSKVREGLDIYRGELCTSNLSGWIYSWTTCLLTKYNQESNIIWRWKGFKPLNWVNIKKLKKVWKVDLCTMPMHVFNITCEYQVMATTCLSLEWLECNQVMLFILIESSQ